MKRFLNMFNQMNRRGSKANLNLFRYAAMVLVLLLGVGNAWAGGGSSNYYASLKITKSGPTGAGSVYVANSNSKPGSDNAGTAVQSAATTSSGGNVTMYWWVDINPGYNVTLSDKVTGGPYSAATANGNVSCKASTSKNGVQAYTATATFVAVTVNSVSPTSVALDPTDASADYPFTVTFATSNLKTIALDLTKSPETADGKFTITSWALDGSNVVASGKFNGGGTYGGASRNNSTTVSLQSKASGSAAKTCTVTANFPALAFTGADVMDVYTTTGDATKTGTAEFNFNYGAEDDFPTTPSFTHTSGSGAFAVTDYTVTPDFSKGTCKVTVNYSFNPNGVAGTTKEELKITSAGGLVATATVTGESEAEATDDVSVTTAAGVTTNYATWAAGLAAANASSGCTLTLLRDIDLTATYGITSTQGITQTFTLDLNGKTLSAAIGGSVLNPTKSGKILTIKDSKTGGRIQNVTPDYNSATYCVNISAGTVNLESGTLYAENQKQYSYGTSSVGGTATNATSMEVRTVKLAAGAKFNMTGGKVEAHGTRTVRAIYQESSNANTTEVNISGGEVYAEAPSYVYGILAYGKVNISGTAQINVKINDGLVNGNATYQSSKFDSYTLHRYGYAIYMTAYANKTPSACYFGTLTMTGGTINVENVNKTLNGTSLNTEHTYGIYMGIASAGMGNANGAATDGTNTQKASSIGSIENATINVTHAGVQVYGVYVLGCYNSFDNKTTPFTIKNSTINVTAWQTVYGALADVSIDWSNSLTTYTGTGRCSAGNIELTNTTINATTTGGTGAYCAWASATYGTVADAKANTGARSTGNATYKGEYAVAGTLTINSGTYTANAATSSAYAIGSSDRAKTIRNIRGSISDRDNTTDPLGSLGGNAEAYPELYIHGGDFSATTGTSTTAIAVKSGGNTVIDGGSFNAYSGAGTAYGLYVTAGKTTASGVTFSASATTKAYGVYVTGGISDWSLFTYFGEVELNNCNASGTARTATDARGAFVEGNTKVYTQASFDAMKSANNSNYQNYGDYAQVGERAFVGKATINGGTYKATAETTTAYGIVVTSTRVSTNKEAIAYSPLTVKNATITAKTNTGTTAYGVQVGGGGLIENCTITATAGTTTASGVRAIDKTTVIKNSTISAKGTDAVYGLEGYVDVSTAHGNCWHGDFDLTEAGSTKVTAESTGSTKAYTIYLNAKAANVASGTFAGDYATAANATINEGEYIAKTNGGTSGYTIALTGKQTKGDASAQPEVLINGGKFNGATAEVGTAGVIGHVQMKGGYYVHSTNLATYIPEGYEAFPLPEDRPEYTAGYRYAIEKAGNHGVYVCQIGSTKYKSLEEALQVVGNNQVIYMIANYTMTTPGDYILPSGATLLIPYKTGSGAGATTAIGNSAKTTTSATTPTLFRKLTFGPGVNLTCSGTIETSAEQKANGQYGANVGMASGAYGQIHMEEGSHISIESGARLNCWGFITGKGTIEVKNGGKILEGFQMADWCGGTNYNNVFKNASTANYVFPITHYFYQSIECPITYRPGCRAYGSTHVNVTLAGTVGQDDVPLVGTSGSMFIMDDNDVSKETWVMKDYDEETDQCIWTINSGASIGNLTISISGYNMKSASYDLPITTNMSIVLNYGEMAIGQNTVMLPGSKLIVNKQGTAVINGVTVVAYDAEDWTGSSRYFATYSPTWGTSSPRKNIPVADAEMFLHGKVNIKGNGGLYTTPSGANIHSTNEDAGEVIYTTAATGNKTSYYLNQGGTTRPSLTVNPAKLKNGDGSYASSASTAAGKTWTYKNDVWDAWSKDGCFLMDAQDKPHAKPAELVELTSKTPDANHLHHDAATGARNFVWDKDCYWWEVSTTPTPEGYYQSLNPDNNGKYNYYYYDSAADCWKIKTLTVTWSINGSNTDYTVGYGTKPHWLGATPTKTSSSSDYVWRWDGWTVGSGSEVLGNEELPYVTANTTFTAHFYEKYYQSLVTFKNNDGTILDSKLWNRGSIPFYEGTPTKEATAAQTFEFNGSWSPAITAVGSSAVEYVAQYTATTRQYTVEFVNYDMSVLGTTKVDYNATPTTDTYKAAIAPSDYEPYKPDNSAYSFVFDGWRLNGASSNGFAQVKGDQTYIAQFTETTKKYRISFVDEDGETVLHWTQLEFDAMPSYDGPATSNYNRQDVEWLYAFSGWDPAEFTAVKGPQTYTATYNKTARPYTITWLNDDNSQIAQTSVGYGIIPSYDGTPTKPATAQYVYTFDGWSPSPTAVTGEATYKATYTSVPTVASVTNNSGTTYHATIEDAITDANGKTGAIVTILKDASVMSEVTISAAMTIDLNGKTISSTQAAATGLFKIDAQGKTVTITDSGTDGKIDHTADYAGYLYGINLIAGSLDIQGGTIYAENTKNAASGSSYRAIGIYYATGNTQAASVTMSNGTVEAKRKQTYAYAICLYTANCELTVTGGEVKASGTGKIRGIYTQGTATLSNAIVSATASGTEDCYAVFSDKTGQYTINSGTYTATGAGTDVYAISVTKASSASVGGSVTVKGGKFGGKSKELYVSGGTASVKGGYYVHNTGLADNCATNYHVLPASLTEGGVTYNYKVVEAYKVTFKNGTTTLQDTYVEKGNAPVYAEAEPTRVATAEYTYAFDGWSVTDGGAVVSPLPDVTTAATYYAHFSSTPNPYTLTWDVNGGDDLTGDYTHGSTAYGTTIVKPADPTKTGYTFSDWTPSVAATMPAANTTYTATWTPNTNTAYTVKHFKEKLEGGYNAEPDETDNLTGTTDAEVTPAVKSYTGFTAPSTQTVTILADGSRVVEYYYTRNSHKVTWDATTNGGSCETAYSMVKHGATIGTLPVATKTGHEFLGWFTTFSGGGNPVTSSAVINFAITYYARFTPSTYTITYKDQGDSEFSGVHGSGYPTMHTYGTVTALVNPTKYGYTFDGWYDNAACKGSALTEIGATAYTEDFTLYAKWTINKYKVTFDSNGGSAVSTIEQDYNTAVTAPANPTREGYTFAGWNPAVPSVMPASNTECVAQWTINQYNLTVETNNSDWGTVTGGGTYDYNTAHTITATPNTGFKFVEWNDHNTNASRNVTVTADVTYTATFAYDIAKYTVKHWQQNINDNDYTEVTGDRQELEGTINEQTAAVAKTNYTGFDVQPFEQETIALSGTVVNIYYNRKTYLITWEVKLNGEQEAYKEETLRYGAMPSYGSTPTKESSVSQVYAFSGWSPTPYAVNKAETYSGSFNVSPRPYTITFVNDNDEQLQSSPVNYGITPEYNGSTPVSSHTGDGYAYTFEGWKPELVPVGGTATYTAKYIRSAEAIVVNTPETVTNNTIASTTTVENGGALIIGDDDNDITLRTTVTVVENGGELVVSNGSSIGKEDPSEESIIIVESGGQLDVKDGGSVDADVFIIQATTEDQEVSPGAQEEVQISGELSETGSKNVSAIYYDLTRKGGTEPFLARVWYAVAVPWAVEAPNYANGGVFIKRGEEFIPQRLGATFDLISYDGNCRAQNGAGANCWVYLEDEPEEVMVPGKLYMIYLTEETYTIRFKKKAGEAIHTNSLTVSAHTETSNANDANWNGIANPATYRAYMNVSANGLVQKFVPGTQPRDGGSYLPLDLTDKQAVGQPFFVQVDPTAGTSVMVTRNNTPTLAPRRAQTEGDKEVRYAIGIAANGKLADRLYIQTAEEKEDKYVIGQDMSKMGISNYVAQMWVARYDVKLCLNTVAMVRDKANFPLGISAPQAGEYVIFAPEDMNSGDIIYLTYDGRVMWNLTMAPYYASLDKGTTTHYGLRLVHSDAPAVTTGVDEVHSDNTLQCTKVIMDDHVYILRGEELYTITGQKAK